MRDWNETLEWYEQNQTTRQIGFNPDGMCLKVCRTARGIGSMFPSAVEAQNATPQQHRVYEVKNLRKGMVGYFDDPNDSNRFGHIATMIGRVPGFDVDDLGDTLWETNSVKSGELVVVRGDYFERYWGDKFKFGATWLNGAVLDYYTGLNRVQRFRRTGGQDYNVKLLDDAVRLDRRYDLQPAIHKLDRAVSLLTSNPTRPRIRKFVKLYKQHRIIRLSILNKVAEESPKDRDTRRIRNEIRTIIKSLPER